jgi:serine/threonine-protein kinase
MGQILAEALEKGALSFEDKIQILTKILAALHHAHGRDVVHGDIKPSNIYLCGDGTIKLMDVGLARVQSAELLIASGNVLSIPYYVSPEQLKGETVDRRSDIYSTGVMAYEMLSGRRPFEPDDETIPSVTSKVISEAPKPMDTDLSRTLPEIEAIVSKAMAKSPDDRYQSAGEMHVALASFLNSSQARLTAIEAAAAPLTFGTLPTQLAGTSQQQGSRGAEALAKAANWWFAGGVAAAVVAVILLGRPGAEMKNAGVPGGVVEPPAEAPTPSPVSAPRATLSPAPVASAVAASSKSVPGKKSTTGSLPVSGAVAIGAAPKPVEIPAVARDLGSKALSNDTDRSAAARELRVPLGVRMANAIAISGNESAKELQKKIDSGDTYTVDARAVTRFVSRYLEDQLTAQQLEEIGDLLEGGEFLEYVGPGSDGVLAQVVYEFSTPAPNRPITKEAAERWLGLLAG